MSGKKAKSPAPSKQLSALQCLHNIKPIPPKYRFLISWDGKRRFLRFGCGHGDNAVFVCSNRRLEKVEWMNDAAARLTPGCVKQFISRGPKVNGSELLRRCQELLGSYAHFGDERICTLVTVGGVATYLHPLFSHFGYLFLYSRFPRSGKTRVQEILSHLCFEATVPLNAPTVPTIRETAAEGHTLVLDTLERWNEKNAESFSAAMELLDAGFRNGGMVAKMVSVDSKWRKEMIPVYAPYLLAAISKDSLTDTALDRAFAIEMHRKPITIKKRKYNHGRTEKECLPLRDDLYRWALENARVVARTYESPKLDAAVDALELNDRAADIWKPLLAVAQALDGEEQWQLLTSLAIEMCRDPEAAERARVKGIAASLRKLVNGDAAAATVGITSEFRTHLQKDGFDIQEHALHAMLTQWGFSQESVRLGQGPRRAWVLLDAKLAEIEGQNGPISSS